jgi:hypothetical protein
MQRNFRIIASAVLLALAPLAHADDVAASPGQVRVATRLSTSFATVAGSQENALALVNALRTGTEVTLLAPPEGGTGDAVATTFTPPTKPMGWGNVSHSLSLAQDSLARLGITNPTNEQLQAALMGGDVTAADGSTVTLRGILQMRADGMGWGQIAKASGTTMGAVVSSTKAMQGKVPATTTTAKASAGITTAAGASATTAGGKGPKGITTASGASPVAGNGPSKGITTATGAAPSSASRGLVTAEGSIAGNGRSGGLSTAASGSGGGHAYGRGLVTASGGSVGAGAATAAAHGRGAGLVSATGASAASNASVTTAAGPDIGHSKGNGKGNGKGGG